MTRPAFPLTLRSEQPADAPAIEEVTRQAFTWDDGAAENRMISRFRAGPAYHADWSVVALEDDVVVGHVLLAPCALQGDPDHPDRPRGALLLGPISVRPDRQRQGIASALMHEIVRRAQASGDGGAAGPPRVLSPLWVPARPDVWPGA